MGEGVARPNGGASQRKHFCEKCKAMDNPPPLKTCADCRRVRRAAFYALNKDKYRTWRERYRTVTNPEAFKAAQERWKKKNPDKVSAYKRMWAKLHPENGRAKQARYKKRHGRKLLEREYDLRLKRKYGEFGSARRALIELGREVNKRKVSYGKKKKVS